MGLLEFVPFLELNANFSVESQDPSQHSVLGPLVIVDQSDPRTSDTSMGSVDAEPRV